MVNVGQPKLPGNLPASASQIATNLFWQTCFCMVKEIIDNLLRDLKHRLSIISELELCESLLQHAKLPIL
jgi:hypothetical protein